MSRLTRAERQASTVAELLTSAGEEFEAKGYHAVTIEAIAERAGYSRGAVYGNFPLGKPDLFLAVAQARAEQYVSKVNAALASADGETIADGYLSARARARRTAGFGRALVEFGLIAADDPQLRERFAALRRTTVEQVRAGLEVLGPRSSLGAHELAIVAIGLEAGLDLLRWVDPTLVADDLEFRVIGRLGGWDS